MGPKAKKAAKPKVPAAHPPYATMIATAIKAFKERNGSSRQAILKYIVANNKVDAGGAAGKKGAGCFKLPAVVKAEKKKPVTKKPKAKKVAKKPAAKKATKAKKPAAKKPAAKKPAAKKPAAKKP